MKRNIAIAFFALFTLATATGVQAQERALKATVPFEFSVGDKQLPADTYTITSPTHGLVTIQSADKQRAVMTIALHGVPEPGKSKLVFVKYGGQYFLHSIVCPTTSSMNVSIPVSNREKRVRSREIAQDEPEQVFVAAL